MKKIKIWKSTGSKLLEKWRIKTVLPHLSGRVLDIGCGFNNLINNYRAISNGTGVGVDIVDWDGENIVVENSSKMPMFGDSSFDTVTFLACINHIVYREEALKEAYRLLTQNGKLIITMIPRKIGDWWHHFTEHFYSTEKHGLDEDSGELGGMNRKEIVHILEGAGFKLVKEIPFMFGINRVYIAKK